MLITALQAAPFQTSYSPATGDPNAWIMPVIIGALIVSAILIVVLFATSKKKGNKKKGK